MSSEFCGYSMLIKGDAHTICDWMQLLIFLSLNLHTPCSNHTIAACISTWQRPTVWIDAMKWKKRSFCIQRANCKP